MPGLFRRLVRAISDDQNGNQHTPPSHVQNNSHGHNGAQYAHQARPQYDQHGNVMNMGPPSWQGGGYYQQPSPQIPGNGWNNNGYVPFPPQQSPQMGHPPQHSPPPGPPPQQSPQFGYPPQHSPPPGPPPQHTRPQGSSAPALTANTPPGFPAPSGAFSYLSPAVTTSSYGGNGVSSPPIVSTPPFASQCPGAQTHLPKGEWYNCTFLPRFAACIPCYRNLIVNSPFSDRFYKRDDQASGATCDMAHSTIRAAFNDACAAANTNHPISAQDKDKLVEDFIEQFAIVQGCDGPEVFLKGAQWYLSPLVPNLDVCPACYSNYVASSPYANSFKRITYSPAAPNKSCDMAYRAVQGAWEEACVKARSFAGSDQGIWIKRFAEQLTQLLAQIQALQSQIDALKQEISNLDARAEYQKQSARMQVQQGLRMQRMANSASAAMNLSSFNMSGNGGSYTTYSGTNVGMGSVQTGNQRFAEAEGMAMEAARKRTQLQQLEAQLRMISGAS